MAGPPQPDGRPSAKHMVFETAIVEQLFHMKHAWESGFEWQPGVFMWSCSVSAQCAQTASFLQQVSVPGLPLGVFLKMKFNTGPYSAENSFCSWYCLSNVSLLCPEDINTILKTKIPPFQQPWRRPLDKTIIPHSTAAVLLSVIEEKVMPVHGVYFSWV